jgi:NAD(P)H-hydrate epimerase
VIHRKVPDLGRGIWTADALESVAAAAEKADAAVFGPGVGTHPESLNVLKYLLRTKLPLVLDADGLNLLAEHPHIAGLLHHNVILTPHPGEIKRLQNAFSLPGTESRQEQAYSLSLYTGAVTVLKGQHSVVAAPDGTVTLNTSGSAALAAAGSGDCLAGLCGAFLANGYPPSVAARMAVFLHGKAGERAAVSGVRGIIADDLPDYFTIDGVFV